MLRMEYLPSEIQTAIVSHLNLPDTIQCAQVSQSWLRFIPPSAAGLWRTLQVKGMMLDTLEGLPVFSSYVKACEIATRDHHLLSLILHKLEGCQPRRLLFSKVDILNSGALIRRLSRVSQELEELVFESANANEFLDIAAVIAACPKLLHFTYNINMIDFELFILNGGSPVVPDREAAPTMAFDYLQTLILSTERFIYPLMPLLRRCPGLKRLQITTKMALSCQEILDACPELQFLHIGELSVGPDIGFGVAAFETRAPGLRHLSIRGGVLDRNTFHFIIKHQTTLEVLHIQTLRLVRADWTLLAHVVSDTLHTLVCDGLHGCDGDSLGSLIRQSPNLTQVRLKDIKQLRQSAWDGLRHLRSLRAFEFSVRYERAFQTEAFREFLLAIGSNRQRQQQQPPPPLERLTISTILSDRIMDWRILQPVVFIPTLKALEVQGINATSPDDIQQLLQSTPQLHTLRLSYVHQLNDSVLVNTIGHLIHLHTLWLINCSEITIDGLLNLIDLRPSLGNLHIVRCNLGDPSQVREYALSRIAEVVIRNV